MKNILLFLLLPLFATTTANAQGDYFAPVGAEWYYGALSEINYPHYSVFRVEKDTVVAGVSCRKITGTYVPRDSAARPLDDIYVYSTPDTVFYYNHTFKRFTPLYIFNIEVGDTVTYNAPYFEYLPHYWYKLPTPPDDSLYTFYVNDKKQINVDGVSLKMVILYPYGGWSFGSYIERIGSLFLFIPLIPGTYIPEMLEISLRCYTDHEISYQIPTPCDAFFLEQTAIDPLKYSTGNISVYPNPSKGNFSINTGGAYPDHGEVIVTDISGREIHQLLIRDSQEIHEYSFPLPAGIYILTYTVNNIAHAAKLVIQP